MLLIIIVLAVLSAIVWRKVIVYRVVEEVELPEKPAAKAIDHVVAPDARPTTLRAWALHIRRELYDTQRKLEGWR